MRNALSRENTPLPFRARRVRFVHPRTKADSHVSKRRLWAKAALASPPMPMPMPTLAQWQVSGGSSPCSSSPPCLRRGREEIPLDAPSRCQKGLYHADLRGRGEARREPETRPANHCATPRTHAFPHYGAYTPTLPQSLQLFDPCRGRTLVTTPTFVRPRFWKSRPRFGA